MQEAYGFNEPAMREVLRRLNEVNYKYDNLARRLATYSTRRHEAVYLPGGKPPKLVRFAWLPSAYGGSRRGLSGATATSNGNINPDNLQYFPKLCEVCDFEAGEFDDASTEEQIYCANLGSLPLTNGYGLAYKLTSSDPNFGTVYAVDGSLMPSHFATAYFSWTQAQTFVSLEDKLIRTNAGTGFGSPGANDKRNWAFGWGSGAGLGDVMLSHFGRYEVTFGFRGYVTVDSSGAYATHTTSGASAGTAHTHTINVPVGLRVAFGFHKNFEPGSTTIGTVLNNESVITSHWPGNIYTSAQQKRTYERSCIIESEAGEWHGQHHTRLSPFISVIQDSKTGGNDLTFNLEECWMCIRPAKFMSARGAYDYLDTGANQYPGGYNTPSAGGGTFVWYGGGSEPANIDEDGAVI